MGMAVSSLNYSTFLFYDIPDAIVLSVGNLIIKGFLNDNYIRVFPKDVRLSDRALTILITNNVGVDLLPRFWAFVSCEAE